MQSGAFSILPGVGHERLFALELFAAWFLELVTSFVSFHGGSLWGWEL
jgi:hypothetical protein